jgi:hypothetical protein
MTFPAKPTTRDLSDLPENKGFPAYNASMAGTNTITNKDPNFGGRGSDSEATHDVVAGNVNWIGDAHDTPDLPGPEAVTDKNLAVGVPESAESGLGMGSPQRTWKGMH